MRCCQRRRLRLQLFQLQLELFDRARDLLRRAAELLPLEPGDLQPELLELQRLGHQTGLGGGKLGFAQLALGSLRRDDPMQRGGVGRQVGEIEAHDQCVAVTADSISHRRPTESKRRAYPAACGRHVRTGIRQSMPSSEGLQEYPCC